MNLKEIDINTRSWIDLSQDRDYQGALVNAALNLWSHKSWSLTKQCTIYYTTQNEEISRPLYKNNNQEPIFEIIIF